MATKYLNLRYKFGGILVSEVDLVYVGGRNEYVENMDEIIYQFLNLHIMLSLLGLVSSEKHMQIHL